VGDLVILPLGVTRAAEDAAASSKCSWGKFSAILHDSATGAPRPAPVIVYMRTSALREEYSNMLRVLFMENGTDVLELTGPYARCAERVLGHFQI